jgi:dihydropyrimidinase
MIEFETVVKGGIVVTALEQFSADIGITGGRIGAIGAGLSGHNVIDAAGLLVLPGGVDSHCHLEQLREDGTVDEESFVSGSISALAGGTTTAITFSTQFKGRPILPSFAEYRQRAKTSMIDYAFHQIVTDPASAVIEDELPELVQAGIRSFKVFLTYDPLHLDDAGFLRVLAAARRLGALVTVHCENYDAIAWRSKALLKAGLTAPKYHAWSRPAVLEREATYRAIALAELTDQPIQIFHVSCAEVAEEITRAQARGLKIWAETCPQYLTLSDEDMDRPGFEGAKFMCSPAPRAPGAAEGLWQHIRRGTIDIVSSDHSGFCFHGPHGKRLHGESPAFNVIPNGVPGVGARLPLLFSEGVATGRITPSQFAALTAFNPARLFGLHAKGRIAPGADADLVLWDPDRRVTLTNALMQHAIDYTPYEGRQVTGWPIIVLRRGEVVMREGHVLARPGSGKFLRVAPYEFIKPNGSQPYGFDATSYV